MAVFTDPTDPKANSYVSLDRANQILEARPWTDAWDDASESPGGRDYVVDDPGAALVVGSTTIPVRDGKGGFTIGNRIAFAGSPSTEYTIAADAPAPVTSIDIPAPGLVSVPADGEALFRFTPNAKEAALIWATSILDCHMDWYGSKRTPCETYNLRWPRSGVWDDDGCPVDPDTIPALLEQLTAETALYMLTRNLSTDPDLLGLGFVKAEIPGPIKVEVDRRMILPIVSSYLQTKASWLGKLKSGVSGQGMRSLPLVRV